MRPVNLIPTEERRDGNGPMRTGPIPYLLVGALVAALVGVTALVLTSNQISDRNNEVAQLTREDAIAEGRAERLAPYTQFQALHALRVATVSSLADSRFDWERVMRELSLILPEDVWLVGLSATASPEVSVASSGSGGGSGSNLRASVMGPALEIDGCASSQEAVAGFVSALKDIDGVTRVGVESSELPNHTEGESASESSSDSSGGDCRTRDFIARFQVVVAFDAAPVTPSASTEAPVAPPAEGTETTSSEGSEGG
jgi:Tfp pilus assembly protein PilN